MSKPEDISHQSLEDHYARLSSGLYDSMCTDGVSVVLSSSVYAHAKHTVKPTFCGGCAHAQRKSA